MDELQIAAVLYRYARAVDTKDSELYRSEFTDRRLHRLLVGGAAAGLATRSSTGSSRISE